jgi:hypothetical protein
MLMASNNAMFTSDRLNPHRIAVLHRQHDDYLFLAQLRPLIEIHIFHNYCKDTDLIYHLIIHSLFSVGTCFKTGECKCRN